MPMHFSRRFFTASLAAALLMTATGCSGGDDEDAGVPSYEGQYQNAQGTVVLEIKDGGVTFTDPKTRQKVSAPVSQEGNQLTVDSSGGKFTLTFAPPDTITGLPPAIAGGAGPVKKVP